MSQGTFNIVYAAASLFSTAVLVATGAILFFQLRGLTKATHAQSFLAAAERLQEEGLRKDRGRLFQLRDDEAPFEEWKPADIETVQRVCHNYDVVGIMARKKMLPKEVIIDSWGNSLYESWAAAEPFVQNLRKTRGSNYWNDFGWLADEAAKWAIKNKTYRPRGKRTKELWGEAIS